MVRDHPGRKDRLRLRPQSRFGAAATTAAARAGRRGRGSGDRAPWATRLWSQTLYGWSADAAATTAVLRILPAMALWAIWLWAVLRIRMGISRLGMALLGRCCAGDT